MQPSLDQILSGYNDRAPLPLASTIPASWYTDPRIAELERLSVFSKTWQLVARTDQLNAPGQFIATTVAAEPIVVVRGNDGILRAFYNVCRHHAAAVVTQPCGHALIARCPYHGWNYGLDGSLKGMPEFEGVRISIARRMDSSPFASKPGSALSSSISTARSSADGISWRTGEARRATRHQRSCIILTTEATTYTATGKCLSITFLTAATTFLICTRV
jgi:nitrite reductase/ring-hydroxylating ferredoxin subunit